MIAAVIAIMVSAFDAGALAVNNMNKSPNTTTTGNQIIVLPSTIIGTADRLDHAGRQLPAYPAKTAIPKRTRASAPNENR